MSRKIEIKNQDINALLNIQSPVFPKYATQILNLANRNAQGTRPKIVGNMSELIQEFPGITIEEWKICGTFKNKHTL
ncbi:MAG: MjaI family restriction endonuclease [Candidatus Spechtbacteria bacterium SB0662_bin_43]|uniref:MjaI family restriction endonuclease n=1 Tax=Candidatus Spechtbacteria bacterium SB0662_bin_43 TaxID=2604897 RepID=A0A845D9B6_9BACT|nr:MjaI family restriction endonuclease [Candidatus Spechtbacteria bacterium SB0662_bin_43]